MSRRILVAPSILLALLTGVAHGSDTCEPGKWRELVHEATLIQKHPNLLRRKDGELEIRVRKGDVLRFKDSGPEAQGAFDHKRAFAVGPREDWIALIEARFDSLNYRLVHAGSGRSETLNGCPVWSAKGTHFVSVNYDPDSGQTIDDATLWYCARPSESCREIWKGKGGGKSARWTGQTLELELAHAGTIKKVRCRPDKAKARCK